MKTRNEIRVWHRHTGEVGGTDYQRLAESKARSSSAYELRDALSRLRRPVRAWGRCSRVDGLPHFLLAIRIRSVYIQLAESPQKRRT